MKRIVCFMMLLVGVCHLVYSQSDSKPVVGVAEFSSEVNSLFKNSVAEKVVDIVTNTKRFTVVDRTSYEKIQEELEFQKTEAFLDSKNTAKQGEAIAAEYMIIGHLVKMNIYTMRNDDGSVNGYKASAAFTLKVNNVESGVTTEAEHFQTEVSPIAASKEQAVNQALNSVEEALNSYFTKTFPVYAKILKLITVKGTSVSEVLIDGGKSAGICEKCDLVVEIIEMLNGKPYPTEIAELKVTKLSGEDFAECKVKKGGKEIMKYFNSGTEIKCKLVVK